MATGIRQRHGNRCSRKGRCDCPWQAEVYSKREGKKIRKLFPSREAAKSWRADAGTAVRKRLLRAPTPTTLKEASDAWLEGARAHLIRTRSGDPYKPGAIRAYERALRLRVLPELGHRRVSDIARTDLQDLVDKLLAEGVGASTIAGTMLPLRAIYRRAMSRGEVAVNPTARLEIPAAQGRRDRIAPPEECRALLAALPQGGRAVGHGYVRRPQTGRADGAQDRGRRPRLGRDSRSARMGRHRGRDRDQDGQGS